MQDYNTIIGTIQMRLNGCPTRSVMDRYKIGSGTVSLIMSRYNAGGILIEDLRMMPPKEVEAIFYPQKNLQRKDIPLPDFQYYYDRIHASKSRVNISYCWLDYKEKNPHGYEKSQFYEYFNRFLEENYGGKDSSMAVNRNPGEKMYIDWVGDQPELLTDIQTGEIKKIHLFVTTLGVSSLIYAEAFPNEKLPCFIEGCTHAVAFYGAVAKYFIPDNLKTAVTKHTKDELILQSSFSDLEDFYGTIVLPPPARKPKGKPTVENHVRYLETHLVEKLKEKVYTSFDELNAAIKQRVAVLNSRLFQNKHFSRLDAFEKYDKPRMKPLPGGSYTICDYKAVLKVPNNYHIEYDGHYYSVLYSYCGMATISIAVQNDKIENICQGDVFRDVRYSYIDLEKNDSVEIVEFTFPMAVIISQACDVNSMGEMIRDQSGKATKFMPSILMCPIYDIDIAKKTEHLNTAFEGLNIKKLDGRDDYLLYKDDVKVSGKDWHYRCYH